MKRSTLTRGVVPAALVMSLALAACGGGEGDDEATDEGTDAASPADASPPDDAAAGGSLSGTLVGAGASSQQAAQAGWQAGFLAVEPDVTVSYDPVGSGSGREQFGAGATNFGGSDSAWDLAEDGEVGGNGMCAADSALVQVPLYVSPVAVAFNLEGIDTLNLQPEVVAGIFAETITNWNDPAIAADNPDAELPDQEINTVFRADESGTSGVFTAYLDAVAPDVWTFGETEVAPGELTPETAQGTSGVVAAIGAGVGSIGYADASQVGELGTVAVGVGEEFVPFSPEAAAAIVDASPAVAEPVSDYDLAIDIDYATEEAGVYPIALVSYSIACETYEDAAAAELTRAYLTYMASPEGQEAAATEAGNAPISDELRTSIQAAIDVIS